MEEYEYSFKVTDIKPYITYCENNNYEKIEEYSQIRNLYKNDSKVMARVTIIENEKDKKIIFDFKDDNLSDATLKVCRESLPLEVTEDNMKSVESILEILDYKIKKELIRDRVVFIKDNVKFEIDNYSSPEVMCVVGIEGEKVKVDKVYKEIKKLYSDTFV